MISTMQLMATAEGYFVGRDRMYNLAGLLTRADLDTRFVWPVYLLGIATIGALWRRFGSSLPMIGVAVVMSLLISPHLHLHDLALLIVPMLMLPVWVPLAASALIAFGFGHYWLYPSVYFLQISLVVSCWLKQRGLFPHERRTMASIPGV
jgi:hypothetical protein